jgi:aspartate/glutamate/aspartate-prephenate aminotransferase
LDVSELANRLKPSPTVFMSDLATEMKREGKDIVSLSVGEPDFATPERIAQAGVLAISQGKTKYSPNAGIAPLRQAVARKLERENGVIGLTEANIVVTNGAKQAVAQTVLATCSPGDEVIVPSPYWVSYPDIARLAGATPVVVETQLEENFLLTPQALEAALTPKSRVLILCSPSNPTGSVYSQSQLKGLARVVMKHSKLLVVSDEIYEHIYYEEKGEEGEEDRDAFPSSFGSCGVEGVSERTVTVNGFSKAFAMTGWRVGYLAAPEPIAKAAAKVQSQFTSGASSLAQYAALEALVICEEESGARGGKVVRQMVKEFRKRRDYACQRLEQIGGAKLPYNGVVATSNDCKPDGAFYLFPDVSSWIEGTGSASSNELCMRILEEAGVALVPGSAFGKETCLRMSYATSMENLEKAFDKIEKWLEEHQS